MVNMAKMVIKRDGSEQAFEKDKIARVVQAAGLTADQAKDLSEKIDSWMQKQSEEKVSSIQIRDQVLNQLRQTDEYAANMFEWYQKTKEK